MKTLLRPKLPTFHLCYKEHNWSNLPYLDPKYDEIDEKSRSTHYNELHKI